MPCSTFGGCSERKHKGGGNPTRSVGRDGRRDEQRFERAVRGQVLNRPRDGGLAAPGRQEGEHLRRDRPLRLIRRAMDGTDAERERQRQRRRELRWLVAAGNASGGEQRGIQCLAELGITDLIVNESYEIREPHTVASLCGECPGRGLIVKSFLTGEK